MFGRKHRKELKEQALKEGEYRPTKELEVDESNLSEEQKGKTEFPWSFIIIAGTIAIIMVVLSIVIFKVGVFDAKKSSSASSSSSHSTSGSVSEPISIEDKSIGIDSESKGINVSESEKSTDVVFK